jgi:uncharacterized glyoxalase superfamily protein PhnB
MEEPGIFLERCIPDFDKAIKFYTILGFNAIVKEKDYMIMTKGNKKITFYGNDEETEHPYFDKFSRKTKRGYGVEIVIMESNVKDLFEKIKDRVKVVQPLTLQPWGKYDFSIEDPFGFYLRFNEK